jgi:hypothetical protein
VQIEEFENYIEQTRMSSFDRRVDREAGLRLGPAQLLRLWGGLLLAWPFLRF